MTGLSKISYNKYLDQLEQMTKEKVEISFYLH